MKRFHDILFSRFVSGELEVDLGGHYRSQLGPVSFTDKIWDSYWNKKDLFLKFLGKGSLNLLTIDRNMEYPSDFEQKAATEPQQFYSNNQDYLVIQNGYDVQCSECGQKIEIRYNGKKVYVAPQCTAPGGLNPWTLELEVPSGKLVFQNDMRDLFPTDEDFYVNLNSEIKKCEEHYAELGMFHVFVGNTCPDIRKFPNGKIIVGNFLDRNYEKILSRYKNSEHVGGVCTDLWWFSACDYDEFIKRSGKQPEELGHTSVVQLSGPGRYKLTSNYSVRKSDKIHEYAVIEKIK